MTSAVRQTRRAWSVAVAATLVFAAGLAALDGPAVRWWSDVSVFGVACAATLTSVRRSRIGDQRRAWLLLAIASGLFAAGQAAWTWFQAGGTLVPFPSVADAAFIGMLPFAGAGGAMLAGSPPRGARARATFDGLTVGLATFMAVWGIVAADVSGRGVVPRDVVALAYPVAYAAVAAVVVFFAAIGERGLRRDALYVAAGLSCAGIVNLAYGVQLVRASYATGSAIDAGWFACFVLVILGARPSMSEAVGRRRRRASVVLVPYLTVGTAIAVLLRRGAHQTLQDPTVLVVAGVCVLFVVSRQVFALMENESIRAELERRVDERTRALAESEERLRLALAAGGLGTFDTDVTTSSAIWSAELEAMHGLAPGTFGGTFAETLAQVHPDDLPAVQAAIAEVLVDGEFAAEYRIVRPDGATRWLSGHAHRFDGAAPGSRLVGVVGDVTERHEQDERLVRLAETDELTGLGNRSLLGRVLDSLVGAESRFLLLLVSLDRFREINDSLGHDVGDAVLVEVGARLRGTVRAGDTVVRLGGDEFAVVVEGAAAVSASAVARQAVRSFAEPLALPIADTRVTVTASIGAVVASPGDTTSRLLRRADIAVYEAKRRHGTTFAVYSEVIDAPSSDRVALIADLRDAVLRGEIDVHYQPKVDVATRRVVAVEALARWHHPRRGAVPPSTFIDIADHVGLMPDLTAHVLRTALAAQRRWRAIGIDLDMAVNITGDLLDRPHFAEDVLRVVEESHADPRSVILEITETALVEGAGARATLELIHAHGIGISIDDFGTGYSAMAYLPTLPITELKLDRTFVAALHDTRANREVVAATIALCRRLGVTAVAEGVEDDATYDALRRLGCQVVQGYYVQRPLPEVALVEWLRARAVHMDTTPEPSWGAVPDEGPVPAGLHAGGGSAASRRSET